MSLTSQTTAVAGPFIFIFSQNRTVKNKRAKNDGRKGEGKINYFNP